MTSPEFSRNHVLGLAAAVLGLFALLVWHDGAWHFFGIRIMRPLYADTVTTLAAAETWDLGGEPYASNPRDPYGRPHSYGPWWLWAAKLGLGQRDAVWLGTLLAVSFVVVAARVLRPTSGTATLYALALLISPPVLLGLERANSDLVIFLLLALAGVLVGRGTGRDEVAAAAVLLVSAALKLYPLVCCAALAARPGRLVHRLLAIGGAAAAFGLIWWLHADEFAKALAAAARPTSIFTYGLPLAPMSWRLLEGARAWLLLGALPVLALGIFALLRGRRSWWNLLPTFGGAPAAAVAGGLAWLLCYAATTNYGYRAVLLLFFVAPWWAQRQRIENRLVLGLTLVAFWSMAPLYLLAAPELSDSELARRGLVVLSGVNQASMLAVSLAVALALAGWAMRRLRSESGTVTP